MEKFTDKQREILISESGKKLLRYEFEMIDGKLHCQSHTQNVTFIEVFEALVEVKNHINRHIEKQNECPFHPSKHQSPIQQQAGEVSAEPSSDLTAEQIANFIFYSQATNGQSEASINKGTQLIHEYATLKTSALIEGQEKVIKENSDLVDIINEQDKEIERLSTLNRKHETQLIGIGQFCAAEKLKHPEWSELLDKIIDGKY